MANRRGRKGHDEAAIVEWQLVGSSLISLVWAQQTYIRKHVWARSVKKRPMESGIVYPPAPARAGIFSSVDAASGPHIPTSTAANLPARVVAGGKSILHGLLTSNPTNGLRTEP
jgi:hypothetical protein